MDLLDQAAAAFKAAFPLVTDETPKHSKLQASWYLSPHQVSHPIGVRWPCVSTHTLTLTI